MARSLKIDQHYIQKVKSAVSRNGYRSQRELAEDLNISLTTISNFLNGRPVDYANFVEICRVLALESREIADMNLTVKEDVERAIHVERSAIETRCREILLEPGSLLRIKAPRQMGKTTLINKVLEEINQQGYRTVYLHLDLAERPDFTDLDKFLQWFCLIVGKTLGSSHHPAEYWNHQFCTSKVNATTYFEEYLLAVPEPLVLCLDKVDRIFRYPIIASDFLGLLRAWHEQAKARDIWKRLRLVVVHSEEPSSLNSHESPFNVGISIELPEFDVTQVETLAAQCALSLSSTHIQQLMGMVGGHPYLVQQLFSHLKANPTVSLEQVLRDAPMESGIYCNHLRDLWQVMQEDPQLADAFKQVITAFTPVRLDLKYSHQLYRMGLIARKGNDIVVRCQLYRLYFQDRLGVMA